MMQLTESIALLMLTLPVSNVILQRKENKEEQSEAKVG
jgi:hypothetical protein